MRRSILWIGSHHNMEESPDNNNESVKQQRPVPTVSVVFDDGSILETGYQPAEKRTAFILWKDGQWNVEMSISIDPFQRLIPYSPNNNLIKNEVVLLPSE